MMEFGVRSPHLVVKTFKDMTAVEFLLYVSGTQTTAASKVSWFLFETRGRHSSEVFVANV